MRLFIKLITVSLILVFSVCMFAGTKKVKSGLSKNGKLVHEHVKVTQSLADTDPNYWKNFSDVKSRPNKMYREPFGQTYIPPHNDQVEIDYEPEVEDYTNSPFDTN